MTLVKHIFVPHGIVNADTTLEEHLWYRAADVDALLDDPQALAAYLVERQKGQP